MELVNTETGEILEPMPEADARRLTTEAKTEFRSSADHFIKGWELIERAVKGGGHVALGYRSPGDYLHQEFDGVLSGLNVTDRRLAVRSMADMGLSVRAIAPVVGVSIGTVHGDQQVFNAEHLPQTPEVAQEGEAEATSGEVGAGAPEGDDGPVGSRFKSEASPSTPTIACGPVVGIDGKTYTRSTPKPVDAEADQRGEDLRFLAALGRDLSRLGLSAWMEHEDRIAELIRNKVGIYALIDGGLATEISMARSSLAFLERIQAKAEDRTLRRIK